MWTLSLLLAGCSDDSAVDITTGTQGGDIVSGEEVMFTTLLPDEFSKTRSAKTDWQEEVNSYKAVNHNYTFKVEMYKEGDNSASGYSYYKPTKTTDVGNNPILNYDGTLDYFPDKVKDDEIKPALYWSDNVNKWGFKATSVSSESIETDQSDQDKWLYQDKLVGYSYLPIWSGTDAEGCGMDDFDAINYRTSKQWYADNKMAKDLSGLMMEEGGNGEEYKKVPLYMKHQRAWITIILRAGEGVKREALNFQASEKNIAMTINSYEANNEGAMVATLIDKAWAREYLIDYSKDKNGEAQTGVSTTRYDAIVAPHNYATKKEEEIIAKINLSQQNFSFYASNDNRYVDVNATPEQKLEADDAYNLEAGKHLTIEATLSRESRKILITAWIEDWTEVATQTICDDYGQNGDPIVIKNRSELISFLSGSNNKQGNVGIIQPTELSLDVEGENWPQDLELNATLNLAGCVLKTGHRLFTNMSSSANLVNGTVQITDGAVVDCAIAENNAGTIERVNVTTTSELTTAKATIAGMVKVNHGTIYQCESSLPVYGAVGQASGVSAEENKYIGGIAAVSTSLDASSMAVIDGCVVNASVNGETVYGGGIVGYTTGRVSNNIYEYGITVSQDGLRFKNIFAQAGADDTRAYGNAWPTTVLNYISDSDKTTNPNNYSGIKYDAVLDCQAELDQIMNDSQINTSGKICRISKSFSVSSSDVVAEDWTHGTVAPNNYESDHNNLSFVLEGNNKTITLTGTKSVKTTDGKNLNDGTPKDYTTAPMLFNYVLGEVKNLNIYLDKPLVASPSIAVNKNNEETYNAEDAIAPLAYGVYGADAKLTNVKVKAKIDADTPANDAYVQASTPAGLVVWAYGGATISNCKVNVPVRMWLPTSMGKDAKHYAGGMVACAAKANIAQCAYLGNSENSVSGSDYSSSAKQSANYFYGGIVGGTAIKNGETPELAIHDCTSWFIAKRATSESEDQSSKGGIIGYCSYAADDHASTIMNGMKEGNEGNWWQLSAIGANTWLPTLTEEKVIGKRNSISPTYNADF